MGFDPDILIPLAGMLTGIILGLPVVRAVVRSIDKSRSSGAGTEEIEELRREVQELRDGADEAHDLHGRVLELEERADFADRLLAQRPAPQPSRLKDGDTP